MAAKKTTTRKANKRATAKPKTYAEVTPKQTPDAIPTHEISFADSYLFTRRVTPFNPDDLVGHKGLQIYKQMLNDEQVKAALFAKEFAVMSTGWEIVAPDLPEEEQETAEELKRFVEFAFGELECGTLLNNLQEIMHSGLGYGYAVTERVYQQIDFGEFAGRVGLRALKTRRPENFDFDTDEYGNLRPDGVHQLNARLPADRFVIWSYRKNFNNFYGNSDLREAYRAWWQKDLYIRFMSTTLERYGEPIVIFKHQGHLTTGQRNSLQDIIDNLQSKTGMILPTNLEHSFESPSVKISEAYIPAINLADTHIRIALLMPGLIGLSAEQITGSFARAVKEFDAFIWVIDQLRKEIAGTVVNDQIIKPLVDLNYEVTGGHYPTFRFKEITEEHRYKIFELFTKAAKDNVLKVTTEDQNKLRDLVEFPPLPEDEEPDDEDDDDTPDMDGLIRAIIAEEDDEEEDDDEETVVAETQKKNYLRRPLSEFEKRVNFQAIGEFFDKAANKADADLRKILTVVLNLTLAEVEALLLRGLNSSDVPEFRIDVGQEFIDVLSEFLQDGWRKGRDFGLSELPAKIRRDIKDIREFAGFEPTEAMGFLVARSRGIKGVLDAELTNKVDAQLFEHLKGGSTTTEVKQEIRRIFEPYIGDPTKIAPSGPGRPRPENLIQAFRLENIVRTTLTEAVNQGRLAVGDRAGDFVIGYEYSAILDFRTTEVDQAADGLRMRKEDPKLRRLTPPLHFQCRGTLIYITEDDLPVKFSSQASMDRAIRLVMPGFGGKHPETGVRRRRRRPTGPRTPRVPTQPTKAIAPEATEFAARVKEAIGSGGLRDEQHAIQVGRLVRDEIIRREGSAETVAEIDRLKRQLEGTNIGLRGAPILRASQSPVQRQLSDDREEIHKKLKTLAPGSRATREVTAKKVLGEIRPMGNVEQQFAGFTSDVEAIRSANRGKQVAAIINDDVSAGMPTSWLQQSRDAGKLVGSIGRRGFYWSRGITNTDRDQDPNANISRHISAADVRNTSQIHLSEGDKTLRTVAYHEMGHRFEQTVDGISRLEKQFYDRRTKGEAGRPYGTDANKVVRPDKFVNEYMGADYGKKGRNENFQAYEILSMGQEMVMSGSYREAWTSDTDFVDFTLGLMAGVP